MSSPPRDPRDRSLARTERFYENMKAFLKDYSAEYTNGYYTGPRTTPAAPAAALARPPVYHPPVYHPPVYHPPVYPAPVYPPPGYPPSGYPPPGHPSAPMLPSWGPGSRSSRPSHDHSSRRLSRPSSRPPPPLPPREPSRPPSRGRARTRDFVGFPSSSGPNPFAPNPSMPREYPSHPSYPSRPPQGRFVARSPSRGYPRGPSMGPSRSRPRAVSVDSSLGYSRNRSLSRPNSIYPPSRHASRHAPRHRDLTPFAPREPSRGRSRAPLPRVRNQTPGRALNAFDNPHAVPGSHARGVHNPCIVNTVHPSDASPFARRPLHRQDPGYSYGSGDYNVVEAHHPSDRYGGPFSSRSRSHSAAPSVSYSRSRSRSRSRNPFSRQGPIADWLASTSGGAPSFSRSRSRPNIDAPFGRSSLRASTPHDSYSHETYYRRRSRSRHYSRR